MSRTIAKLVTGVINTITRPLSPRQRKRTIARVIANLQKASLAEIETQHGVLRLNQLASAHAASAAERFFTDEPEMLTWIDGFAPGETFWDVGASIGVYSIYAALNADREVYAFEPSGFNFGLLIEHIALNHVDHQVKPFCVALGRTTAINTLHMKHTTSGTGGNALGAPRNQYQAFEPKFSQAVLAYSMDDFIALNGLEVPAHLKIDVDGIEPEILAGATQSLPKLKSLMLEVEGRDAEEIATQIEAPLRAAGLIEQEAVRERGSGRNRLYLNAKLS